MNLTLAEGAALVESFLGLYRPKPDVDVAVCPSFVSLARIRELIRNTPLKLGAQDVFWEESGAYTGQVSAKMLGDLGTDYCIVGHSESRGRFGSGPLGGGLQPYFVETVDTLRHKLSALFYRAVTPVLCIGETADEREAGRADQVVTAQVTEALSGFDPAELFGLVLAYEPVWAIGTGNVCGADEAGRMCGVARAALAAAAGSEVAETVRILYGGSLKPDNAHAIFQASDVDGGLVGGSSLDASAFAHIVNAAA